MSRGAPTVSDRDGQPGVLDADPADLSDPDAQVGVRLPDGRHLRVPVGLLTAGDGGYRLDLSFGTLGGDGPQVLREIEERIDVRTETVETGRVRAVRRVETRDELVDVPTWRETVEVEHVEINEYVDRVQPVRQEGSVTVVPVYAEVLVVETRLLLREEVRFTVRREDTSAPQRVALRRSHVEVERTAPPPPRPSDTPRA